MSLGGFVEYAASRLLKALGEHTTPWYAARTMSGTQVTQHRRPVVVDSGTRYEVSATCTLAGTLPDTALFVRQIVNMDDPKDDLFYRLAAPADFLSLPTNRNTAIQTGPQEDSAYLYRATSFSQTYADVAEATGAWQELSSRISQLVIDYDEYIDTFLTPDDGEVTTYPTVDEGVKAGLIAAYEATLADIEAAEATRDTENAACEALRVELLAAQTALQGAQADAAALGPIVGSLAPVGASVTSLSSGVRVTVENATSLVYTSAASSLEKSGIAAQLNTTVTQTQALDAVASGLEAGVTIPLGSLLATLQGRVTTLQSDVDTLVREVNACGLEMATMQGAVDAARGRRDAALAELREVCPDYVP